MLNNMLNNMQKYLLTTILNGYISEFMELKPIKAIIALKSVLITDENEFLTRKNLLQEFRDIDINTIEDMRKILTHNCPQNRSTGNVGVSNGIVYYSHGQNLVSEPEGLLSLTAHDDDTDPEKRVTKDDVVSFTEELVKQQISEISKKFNQEENQDSLDQILLMASKIGNPNDVKFCLDFGANVNTQNQSSGHIKIYEGNKKGVPCSPNFPTGKIVPNSPSSPTGKIVPCSPSSPIGRKKIVRRTPTTPQKLRVFRSGRKELAPRSLTPQFDFMGQGDKCTPLHYAVLSGNVETVRILIQAGARLDMLDIYGNPPLHYAVGNKEVLEILEKAQKQSSPTKLLGKHNIFTSTNEPNKRICNKNSDENQNSNAEASS